MTDRRKQIPIGCAINIAIINELSQTEEFKKACVNVPIKYGITPPHDGAMWPFFNISWGAYMMYSLFVVSKELYNLPKEDEYFQHLVTKKAMKDFNIIRERKSFSEDPKYHFSSFRNAISHDNYVIDDDKIKLWDHPPRKPNPEDWHWIIEIPNNDFLSFLGIVNEANFRLYNEINSGLRNSDGTKK